MYFAHIKDINTFIYISLQLKSNLKQTIEMIDQAEAIAIEPLVIGQWLKEQDQRHPQQPTQRRFHSAIIHKLSLYIYGGILQKPAQDPQAEQCTIYRYNITSKIWTKITTHFLNNNSFSFIYAHSTIIYNNMMYLFGGKNYNNNHYLMGLWCLNLQSYNWKRQELKGYSPLPRQHASMILHQKSSIFLYGGRNGQENLNDIHIYRIQNKLWVQVEENSYDLKLPCRLKPAICSLGQHIYLFGGERMLNTNGNNINILQKDFYQLRLINKPMSNKPDIWIKQIITNYGPNEKVASFVMVGEKYLVLWGGDTKLGGETVSSPGIWVYSVNQINWTWLNFKKNVKQLPTLGSTFSYINDRCFFFGQYKVAESEMAQQNLASFQNDNSGLLICQLQMKQLQTKLSLPHFRPKMIENNDIQCQECIQYNHSLKNLKLDNFDLLTLQLQDRLPFVYSAFGLLVDNAQIGGAKQVRVLFHHTFKEKYCLIEDNGVVNKLWSSNTQFISDFSTLRTYVQQNIDYLQQEKEQEPKKASQTEVNQQLQGLLSKETKQQRQQRQKQAKDKQMQKQLKKRKRIAKQNFRRKKQQRIQYSRNVKLGALRIGDRLVYISRYGPNNQNRRVFILQKETNSKEDSYRIYYYIVESGSLVDSSMDSARKYIDQEYKAFIKIANDKKDQANNFLFISKLKEIVNQRGQIESQLKESPRHNDIFCCQKKLIQSIDQCSLTDSIDVSLKNYLALLYLKSDQIKISLSITQHKNLDISNSQIFDRIDTLVKSDRLIDLMTALDLSNCNIIEVYYNKTNISRARDMNRKTANQNFLNGVVFYHKNRLVSRYKFDLGETPKLFKYKLKSMQQNLLMFGFIEIKDDFAVNIFKTGFVRDDLLEQIYHRLKFVEKYAERFNKEVREQSKKLIEQKMQPPKKRFKGNDQVKQDLPNNNQVIQIDQ